MRLDVETAFRYLEHITEAVERVGGVLTLLWHPNSVINPPVWHFYLRMIEFLKQKNAWFGGVQEVAEKYGAQPVK